jgi:hypothetical protein
VFIWQVVEKNGSVYACTRGCALDAKKSEIQVPVPLQPLDLRTGVAEGYIALVVLEAPGYDDQEIPFPDPESFFDLSLYPAQARGAISASHRDVVCTKHQFSAGELFLVFLFRQPYTDNFLLGSWVPVIW